MSRYGSGRKYAYAVAGRLGIEPDLFVSAMKEASMPLTAFDKLNEDHAQLDQVTKAVGNKAVAGLYALQQQGDTPEIAEGIKKLEARGFSKDRA
jgi:hypothetical protein